MTAVRKPVWKKIGYGFGIGLLILLGIAQFFKKDLMRLKFVLTISEPAAILENFRSMTRVFDHRTVRRNGPTYRIPYQKRSLPETYTYAGSRHNLTQWITKTATTGMIVVYDGKIAFERYFHGNHPKTPWISWSLSHPVVSALVGVAMEEGLIRSVSDLVIDYVPALKGTGYDGVTLKDVLQMRSGVAFDENTGNFFSDINRLRRSLALGATMDDVVAARHRDRPPGTRHHVTGIDTQVLAMVLREATGRTLTAYMEEKLWSRIGAEADADWLVDSGGMALAFWGLNAVLRDYARFGLLYVNDGKNFRAQQIIPAHWIRASLTPDRPRRMPGAGHPASSQPLRYGYHWWLPEPADEHYCAIGEYGQFIYIHPRGRVVIVKISADTHWNQPVNDGMHESLAAFRAIATHMSRNP